MWSLIAKLVERPGPRGRPGRNRPLANALYVVLSVGYFAGLMCWSWLLREDLPPTPAAPKASFEIFKAAVDTTVAVSMQINAGCIALLTILAAFIGFVLTVSKREPDPGFRLCAVVAGLASITSMWTSGIAITKARNALWSGSFDLEPARDYFTLQALWAVVGLIFFSIVLIVYGDRSRHWRVDAAEGSRA